MPLAKLPVETLSALIIDGGEMFMMSLHLVRGSKSSYPRLLRLVKWDWKSSKLAVDIPLSRWSFGSFCASESSSVLHSVLRLYAKRFGGAGGTTAFVLVSLLSGVQPLGGSGGAASGPGSLQEVLRPV